MNYYQEYATIINQWIDYQDILWFEFNITREKLEKELSFYEEQFEKYQKLKEQMVNIKTIKEKKGLVPVGLQKKIFQEYQEFEIKYYRQTILSNSINREINYENYLDINEFNYSIIHRNFWKLYHFQKWVVNSHYLLEYNKKYIQQIKKSIRYYESLVETLNIDKLQI